MNDSPQASAALFDPAEYGSLGPSESPVDLVEPPRITPARLMLILKGQCFRCAYTGRKLTPQTADIVYHVPLKEGGDPSVANMRIVVKEIAQMMRAASLSFDSLAKLCQDVCSNG